MRTARHELKGMATLSFSVPIREGHDDHLVSLALGAARASILPAPPRKPPG